MGQLISLLFIPDETRPPLLAVVPHPVFWSPTGGAQSQELSERSMGSPGEDRGEVGHGITERTAPGIIHDPVLVSPAPSRTDSDRGQHVGARW